MPIAPAALTVEALKNPAVGMTFTERYSFFVYVLHVTDKHVVYFARSGSNAEILVRTREAFVAKFLYDHNADLSWVDLIYWPERFAERKPSNLDTFLAMDYSQELALAEKPHAYPVLFYGPALDFDYLRSVGAGEKPVAIIVTQSGMVSGDYVMLGRLLERHGVLMIEWVTARSNYSDKVAVANAQELRDELTKIAST